MTGNIFIYFPFYFEEFSFSDYVQPICLVDNDDEPMVGDNAVIAGWGKTLNGK